MKIAIYGRSTENTTFSFLQLLFDELGNYEIELVIHDSFHEYIKGEVNITNKINIYSSNEDLVKCDATYMLSVGGDGTFLATLKLVRDSGIPILGINTGRLGFLANVAQAEINIALSNLLQNKFKVEKRALIKVGEPKNLFNEINYGLNEFTIFKKNDLSIISVQTYINEEYLNTYFADGLIIATPTGSTAYSLSCGGPLVMPGSKNFVITPIAPHNLNVRPLVISDDNKITLKVESRGREYLASLDSNVETINASEEITVEKADFELNVIKLENQNFFTTIRNKLLWGADKRNY